jgi:hypothetical protein
LSFADDVGMAQQCKKSKVVWISIEEDSPSEHGLFTALTRLAV